MNIVGGSSSGRRPFKKGKKKKKKKNKKVRPHAGEMNFSAGVKWQF